jgi:hypothetical protein
LVKEGYWFGEEEEHISRKPNPHKCRLDRKEQELMVHDTSIFSNIYHLTSLFIVGVPKRKKKDSMVFLGLLFINNVYMKKI